MADPTRTPFSPRPRPASHVRRAAPIALAAVTVALAGCDDLEEAFDCIDGDRPQFGRTVLPSPTLNEFYRESVTVSIENTSDDDAYGYEFAVDGELPPGIGWYEQEPRTVVFEGTPIETGTWTPTLGVRVTDGGTGVFDAEADADGLCRTRRSAPIAFEVRAP